jgi:hypothetical protein
VYRVSSRRRIEHLSVTRYLHVETVTAARAATERDEATAVGVEGLNLNRESVGGRVAAPGSVVHRRCLHAISNCIQIESDEQGRGTASVHSG